MHDAFQPLNLGFAARPQQVSGNWLMAFPLIQEAIFDTFKPISLLYLGPGYATPCAGHDVIEIPLARAVHPSQILNHQPDANPSKLGMQPPRADVQRAAG